MNFRGKKWAIYLRRSKGEKGSTKEQLEQILSMVKPLEKSKKMRQINRGIQGRDINKNRRGVEFFVDGDIWNEGDGFSGFNVDSRPVFMELLERVRKGQYDGVLAVSMDRFARSYGALSRYAYDLWGEMTPAKIFYGFAEKMGLGEPGQQGIINEKVLSSLMEWGGLAKQLEIQKAEQKRTGTSIDRGYLTGSTPEFRGKTYRGKTTKIVEYRKAFDAIKAKKSPAKVAFTARKFTNTGQGQASWTRTWKPRLLAFERLGVLEDWLDAFEAINQYILNLGGYPANAYKSTDVSRILKHSRGYFGYPAGVGVVNPQTKIIEFIEFPNPLEIGLDALASVEDPMTLEGWEVTRREIDEDELANLDLAQTQPRAQEEKKKRGKN